MEEFKISSQWTFHTEWWWTMLTVSLPERKKEKKKTNKATEKDGENAVK